MTRFSAWRGLVSSTFMVVTPSLLAQSASTTLEQVIVTARKRSEIATEVPVAMNVFDGADMEKLRLRNLPDLAGAAQNVTLFEDFPGAGQPTWVIRGVGLQDFNSNNTPTAAVYADGIYQVSNAMGNLGLFDIDQAAILKGPQGGLYGRNTTGGAVLLNSRRARLNASESVLSLGVGRWQQTQLDAMFNVPVTDTLAWRLAGRVESSDDGWQRSLSTGATQGARDRFEMRSWLRWQASPQWQIDWKLEAGNDDSDIALGRSVGLYDRSATGRFCTPVLAGRRDDAACINFGGVNLIKAGRPASVEALQAQAADGSLVYSSNLNRQANDHVGTLVDASWQGSSSVLKLQFAYDSYGYGVALDLDGSGGEYGHRLSNSDIDVWTASLQWASSPQTLFSWMLGLDFTDEQLHETRDFNLRDNGIVGLGQGKLHYLQTTGEQAAFVDLGWQATDTLKLNGNLRYTREQKEYRDGDFYIPLATPFYLVRGLKADYDLDQHVSGSVGLEYLPQKGTLWYAKLSHGFKSGGFYGGFPFSAFEIAPYQAETLLAYEAGLKQEFPAQDLHLELAVFHYDYQDVQGFVRDINPVTGTGVDRLANMADARHDGAELSLDWQPSAQWQFTAAVGWLDAVYVDAAKKTTNIAGSQVYPSGQRPYAPEQSANFQVRHLQSLAGGYQVDWWLGYEVRSSFQGEQSSLVDAAINKLPGYGKLDLVLGIGKPNSPWNLSFWVRNAGDHSWRTRVKSDGLNSYVDFFSEPRSYGMAINYRPSSTSK